MRNRKTFFCLMLLSGFFFFSFVFSVQLHTVETEHLRLVYFGRIHAFLVPHIARSFENSFKLHRELFNYTPTEKVTLLLHDFNDYTNAAASAIPLNTLILGMAPFSHDFETMPLTGHHAVMNHELVHVLAMDQATGADKFFRSLFFGKVAPIEEHPLSLLYAYLTTPRRYAPTWYHEGIAVFLETWMNGGLGRALGAYDEMVFRTKVRDGAQIFDLLALESAGTKIDFQVGVNSYLYGTRFMSYLALKYDPESLIKWVSRTDGSKGYFVSQFKHVYGLPLDHAWSEWVRWEHQFQKANLELIRRNPTTPFRDISQEALGSVSRAVYDSTSRNLYVAVNYPGQLAHILAINIDTGKSERICDIKGPALYFVCSLTLDQETGTLFYTTDNNDWRDLQAVDVKTGQTRKLMKDVRVGDLAFNQVDRSLWGVRHYNGISTLVRIPHPYTEWNQIHSCPFGKDIYDISVSPDGKILSAALAEITGRQSLIKLNIERLMEGDAEYEILEDFETSTPASFVFSPDGRYLFGSSYYSGVSNIYRHDFAEKKTTVITNCETGFFRPLPLSDDSLIIFRYTGEGFVPAVIANKKAERADAIRYLGQEIVEEHPIVKDWRPGSIMSVDLDSEIIYEGEYQGLKKIRPVSIYPVVEGYKNFAAVGMRFNFISPLRLHKMDLTASYTPNRNLPAGERMHFQFNYSYFDWEVNAKYNGADFYDLFGPTKRSRKGYSLAVNYNKSLIYDTPKLMDFSAFISGYGGMDRLPFYQNIASPVEKMMIFGARLNYSNLRASLGAVSYEKGVNFEVTSVNNVVHRDFFPQVYTQFDYGFALPIHHSSVWARSSLGFSAGDRENPFANFYFGGFGNNWVDHLSVQRYRKFYSFPGVELNEIGGKNFAKLLVEWDLPPVRFHRIGTPSFYATWARPALFCSGIVTNMDSDEFRRKLVNVGAQIDFRFIVLSHMNLTFSVGYARAFENGRSSSNEFMASLKVF